MPFRSMADQAAQGMLTPDDLKFLQEVYEAATAGLGSIDQATMHECISNLLFHYRAGETRRDRLIALATRELTRAAG